MVIAEIAKDFVFLQESREQADYDLSQISLPPDAKYAVDRAHRLMTNVRAAQGQCPDDLQAFMLSLVLQSRAA